MNIFVSLHYMWYLETLTHLGKAAEIDSDS